jgi:hypothetical protein
LPYAEEGGVRLRGSSNAAQSPAIAEGMKYVPPHARRLQSKPDDKRRSLTVDEIYLATPPALHSFLDKCDMDGCDADIWGIPLCIEPAGMAALQPYVQQALNKLNRR